MLVGPESSTLPFYRTPGSRLVNLGMGCFSLFSIPVSHTLFPHPFPTPFPSPFLSPFPSLILTPFALLVPLFQRERG